MNDIREILNLVVEHKAIRKLYSINGIDNSLINRLIIEETLREQSTNLNQILIQGAAFLAGADDEEIKGFIKGEVENNPSAEDIADAYRNIAASDVNLTNAQTSLLDKFMQIKNQIDGGSEDDGDSGVPDGEPDEILTDIKQIFSEMDPEASPKEKLIDALMQKKSLSVAMAKYQEKIDPEGNSDYTNEGLNNLRAMMSNFEKIYKKLGLDAISANPDKSQIRTKISALGDKLTDKAAEETVRGIEKNFKTVIDRTVSKIDSTDAKQKRTTRTEKTQLIIKNLRAYSRRVDSFISFMEKFKTNVETKFEKDLDKRQVLVDILKSIESQLPTAKAAKEEIEDVINDVAEIRRGMLKEGSGQFKGIFKDGFFTELEGFEEIGERIKNIETNIGEIQTAFNEKIKEPALEKESYTIQKKGIEDDESASDNFPVTVPQIDDFLETFAQLMAFPEGNKGIDFISFKDYARAAGLEGLGSLGKNVFKGFGTGTGDFNPAGKIGKAASKVATSVKSMLREDDEQRHGLMLKNIGLEGDGVAQVSNDDQRKKIIKKIMQGIEPYKEELVLAMIEAYASTAINRDPPNPSDSSFTPDDLDTYNASAAGSYFNNVDGSTDIKNKAPDADMRFLIPFKKMEIFNYLNFLGQNETSLRGIQFDIYSKVQKKKINTNILKDLVAMFEAKNVLENGKFESFTKSLFNVKKDLEESLKPVIQKIMESWEHENLLKEASVERSDEWLDEITVLEFLDSLEDKGKELNIEAMQKAIAGAERKFSKEIAEIEQKNRPFWRKVWGATTSAKSLEAVSGFLSDAIKATAGGATAVGTGAAVMAGSAALAAPVFAVGVIGYFVFAKASDMLSEKVVEMAVDAGTALEKLDIKDQDLNATPAYNIVDISDDTKKVVIGPDGELSGQETAALAAAYKKIEEAFQKIQEEQNQLSQLPGDTPEEVQARLVAWQQHHNKPMKTYLDHTADSYVKQAYAKMIKLSKDVTINKDGTT